MNKNATSVVPGTTTVATAAVTDTNTAAPVANPALVSGLLRQGVAPHVAVASAQARAQGLAARKRRIRAAAVFYDRRRDLPPLWPRHLEADLLAVDTEIGLDWTRHILLRLARMLKYHRTDPLSRPSMAVNIAIAMTGEAAILRRQRDNRGGC